MSRTCLLQVRWLGAVIIVMAALAGCGVKLVDLGPAPNLYDISPEPEFAETLSPVSWQLTIEEPTAATALDTDRILVRPGGHEVKYFAHARWAERAPRLVQSKLVHAFDKTEAIVGVGRQAIGLRGDYDLQGELRSFDAVYSGGSTPTIEISLTLKIVRQPSAVIIASRTFEKEERATSPSLSSITESFENALGRIMSEAVPWTLSMAQADYEQRAIKFRGAPRPAAPSN